MQPVNFQMFKLNFKKAEDPEIKLPTFIQSLRKQRKFQRKIYFCFINNVKAFNCVYRDPLWKLLKEMEYQTKWFSSWEICMQVRKQQLKLDMEQQTGSKLRKEYVKAVYCHPAYLIYMQSTSWEMLGWIKHKLESRFLGEM